MDTAQQPVDEKFMTRAFELAANGLGSVSPNPIVGCVIAHGSRIIGEGWHRRFGGPHAEVNAVEVADKTLLKDSTAYVTLEPCSHFGKTPPCADLLIAHRIRRVVVSNVDPNPLVSGQGIAKLRAAGIEVQTGMLQQQGRHLNRRFFCFMEAKRPYIILKWAQTADGFIARENFDSRWISHAHSRVLVHKWRAEEDAILVGRNTARHDDPQLTVRDWTGKNPVRVVLDRSLSLPAHLQLFDGSVKTICYNLTTDRFSENRELVKLPGDSFLKHVIADLFRRNIQSLMVEGGSQILRTFIDADLWDEARVFHSPIGFGSGIPAPHLPAVPASTTPIQSDTLNIYYRTSEWNTA
ncbi:MAG TPA: bifunctional diaminohydroxyphosphoribosylaminopyrimidine deaminase/5-amino-6-(5-phosphoribosylamino)uracil reductase RibD [Chryseosolibacter sp.]|nr:bifunctional diaminohydroxyphosphoribosylaminopyrimidine deaminase/5-amino-6-(5-phosphoribosylamino)uracil reductase RibD [Chryseosolibacter sp.]